MNIHTILLAFLIFVLPGCIGNPSATDDFEQNLEYSYTIESQDNNLIMCDLDIEKPDEFYFNITSSDSSNIDFGLFNLVKSEIDIVEGGMIEFKNAEIVFDGDHEYFGKKFLESGEYFLIIYKAHSNNIAVSIESSHKLFCYGN
jgi:hypothetical protein